ncbi:MAG: D-sedoheptulose 7-phosphate isomerase [Chloroflexi bacterium]|nr:D-sedoheptulose 7-phosphate isomerase [Chloroflexota bacterium]
MNHVYNHLSQRIASEVETSIQVKQRVIAEQISILDEIAQLLIEALRAGGKVLVFGNGGSAADSQHIAAELVSRFRRERGALPSIALTTDTSILTAIANDYSFDRVFARQVEALGQKGDVALGISTSGNSPNVLSGMMAAREQGMRAIGFTGEDGGKLKDCVDLCFRVPSRNTARIQEAHITIAHALCEIIEQELFPSHA